MHCAVPLQAVVHPLVQDWIVQVPGPEQFTAHFPPAQSTTTLPVPVELTLQEPPAQLTMRFPVASFCMTHLPSGQLKLQLPTPAQRN